MLEGAFVWRNRWRSKFKIINKDKQKINEKKTREEKDFFFRYEKYSPLRCFLALELEILSDIRSPSIFRLINSSGNVEAIHRSWMALMVYFLFYLWHKSQPMAPYVCHWFPPRSPIVEFSSEIQAKINYCRIFDAFKTLTLDKFERHSPQ